jgi:hypothetical protein
VFVWEGGRDLQHELATYLSWYGEADWLTDWFGAVYFEKLYHFIIVDVTPSFWHKATAFLRI